MNKKTKIQTMGAERSGNSLCASSPSKEKEELGKLRPLGSMNASIVARGRPCETQWSAWSHGLTNVPTRDAQRAAFRNFEKHRREQWNQIKGGACVSDYPGERICEQIVNRRIENFTPSGCATACCY